MELDLRALQLAVEAENSIEHTRDVLTEAVEFLSGLQDNDSKVRLIFDQMRDHFDISNLEEKNIFFYDSDTISNNDIPDKYKAYSLGLFNAGGSCSYSSRLVYPVRDVKNKVMGLCGWDPTEQPKYLDSKTYGYNAKRNCLYGMEKLKDYYLSKEPVFIVEGIPCCNYLRSKGFNSLSLLGSSISVYVIEILKRLGDRCILLPDNDEAGLNVLRTAKYKLPKARCYVSLVAKDIDDTRRANNGKFEQDLLNELSSIKNPFSTTRILGMLK